MYSSLEETEKQRVDQQCVQVTSGHPNVSLWVKADINTLPSRSLTLHTNESGDSGQVNVNKADDRGTIKSVDFIVRLSST